MTSDIKQYIETSDKCQRVNNKFSKSTPKLHPIPIEPEVETDIDIIQPKL